MPSRPIRRLLAPAALALAMSAAACDDFNDPPRSPTEGLTYVIATDSAGSFVPPAPLGLTPGHFVGTILGAPLPGTGNDSLASMPRIVGATVTAYPVVAGTGPYATVDDAAASAITDANGRFTLPEVPGGEYLITFEPPAGSAFQGSFVAAIAHEDSHEFAHWIILARK